MKPIAAFAILAPLALIAACDIESKNAANSNGDVSIDGSADGSVKFDLPFAKGQMKLPASMMDHGQVDIDGVKLMPGSKLTGFSVKAGDGKNSMVNIGFTAPKAPTEVSSYFASEFAKVGAQTVVAGDTLSAVTKDGDKIAILVNPDGAGSKGTIAIQDKE